MIQGIWPMCEAPNASTEWSLLFSAPIKSAWSHSEHFANVIRQNVFRRGRASVIVKAITRPLMTFGSYVAQ